MAASKGKKADWWDTFLYLGVFLLVFIFLYELLKLWNAGVTKAQGWGTAIAQAAQNALTDVEQGLTNLIANPVAAIENFLSAVPNFFSLLFSWINDWFLAGGFLADIISFFSSLFTPTATPTTTGLGSSTLGTTPVIPLTTTPVNNGQISAGAANGFSAFNPYTE